MPQGAHTLERNYYVNPDMLKKEYDKLFLNQWICAGRAEELAEAGQYKVINIGTESAIVLRDEKWKVDSAYKRVSTSRNTNL